MEGDASKPEAVLIVSEKLTENERDWNPIPPNHFISVDRDLQIRLNPMQH
jgi:predicted glutamine amidotransferase